MTRRIAVFTSSRADLGPLGPVLRALDDDPGVKLVVIATGTHVAEAYGGRIADIRLSASSEIQVIDVGLTTSDPSALGPIYGAIATGVSQVLGTQQIDILVLLGDRWELLAAAGASLLHGVPIAHLHGGETTEGAIDERIRHGITKLSDLHLCATQDSARRIRQLGEEAWRITITGAPGLDRMHHLTSLGAEHLHGLFGRPVIRPFGVVVYHAPTVDRAFVAARARAVFDAAGQILGTGLLLYPGVDPGADAVIAEIESACHRHSNLVAKRNLGNEYLAVLKAADVLIGNSSSGIIEAASLSLPVVDVGDRQGGRLRPRNVVHVSEESLEIAAGIRKALDDKFRAGLAAMSNPYGDGAASAKIVRVLLDVSLERLTRKPLVEIGFGDISIEALSVSPDATLREGMAAIDRGRSQIAFVVAADGRLLGSVSDGDIRRALLAGARLSDELKPYMTTVPVVTEPDTDAKRALEIMEYNGVTQLPVVDDQGLLVGVHLMRVLVKNVLDGSV